MASPYVQVITQGVFPLVTRVVATAGTITSSSTNALLNSMTITPAAGSYNVRFVGDFESNASGAAITALFRLGGVDQTNSQQKIIPFDGGALSAGAARGMMVLEDLLTVNGSQTIEVYWSISSGTATAAVRKLILQKVTIV